MLLSFVYMCHKFLVCWVVQVNPASTQTLEILVWSLFLNKNKTHPAVVQPLNHIQNVHIKLHMETL